MEISEQVGMTAEIIQKVIFVFTIISLFCYKLFIFLSTSNIFIQFSTSLFAASRQSHHSHHGEKEGMSLL